MIKILREEKDLMTAEGITLVDFYADWCGPCKMMMPLLEDLGKDYPDITILKVDADSFPELMLKHAVTNVPTLDIYENGEKKTRKVGYVPKEILLKNMEQTTTFKRKL
jgi:thioredoxin 1